MSVADVLELGWQINATFVSAYLGYVVAYTGRRKHHKSIDATFIILAFALISLTTIDTLDSKIPIGNEYRIGIISVCAVLLTVISAVLWRAKIFEWVQWGLSKLKADQDDGFPTAWETIIHEPSLDYSEIYITLKNGRRLASLDMVNYDDLPSGCCVLGSDGSIGMYVTAILEPDNTTEGGKEEWRIIDSISDDDGHRITYIPVGEIVEVDLRRMKK